MSEPTQSEKLAALHNDRLLKRGATLSEMAELFVDRPGGRYANANRPATEVPRQPEHSPWAADVVGVEPPLGVSVSEAPVVGEPHEVERSIETAAVHPAPCSPCLAATVEPAAVSLIRRRC